MRRSLAARRLTVALSVVLVVAGCAHVRRADPTTPRAYLDEVNAGIAGQVARVRLSDGTEMLAQDVSVSADSLYMRPQKMDDVGWWLGPRRAVPIRQVASVEVTRRGRGAVDGGLLGFGVGAVAGSALVLVSAGGSSDSVWGTEGAVLVWGPISGAIGACVGSLLGAVAGSREVYDLTALAPGEGPAPTSK
jgi:hypothetical protein